MNETADLLPGASDSRLLLIADHASNRVPPGIDLGIDPALMDEHIAVDIGIDALARAVARRLGCPAIIARLSRLVVDLNRDPDDPAAVPVASDGRDIPGNASLSDAARGERIARFWHPYHALLSSTVDRQKPSLLFNLHSFTPQLTSRPDEERPWEIGILYNRDDRAARIAVDLLRAERVVTGDNQPYSGRLLNATMNRHAEARGLPYLGIEVRQDLISDQAGVEHWADLLAPVVEATFHALVRARAEKDAV